MLSALLFGALSAPVRGENKPPHIMFMVVDDLGWNDMGWQDQFNQIQSPKLWALRNESIRLDQYYVYRYCSPSRSTFQTGRYPWHLGQQTTQNLNPMPGIACGINLKYKFIGELLKERAGYSTWALGKWHLGFLTNEYTPTYRGYDSYLGYYSGAEEHFTHTKVGTGDNISKSFTAYDLSNNTGTSIEPCREAVGNASATYSSYLYANETIRLLDKHDPSKPLYVYLAWNNVHDPNEAPQSYVDMHGSIQNKGRKNLAAMVSALDDSITAVVQKLKDKGMWDNTLLVFTTDNGGNLGGSGINYPLRGGKYTFWQGGVRGNAFVGGGLIPESLRGTTWAGAAHAADWYSTFASMAGIESSDSGPLAPDGVDLSKALLSGDASPRSEVVIQIVSNKTGNDHALPPAEFCEFVRGKDEMSHCSPPGAGIASAVPADPSGLTCGVLIQGKWKLVWGYPGWTNDGWNGWITPPQSAEYENKNLLFSDWNNELDEAKPQPNQPCAVDKPCLFDIMADPTEHNDVASDNQDVVESMKQRVLELLKGEVTLKDAGLCPRSEVGTKPDPRMTQLARKIGFWEPWLKQE